MLADDDTRTPRDRILAATAQLLTEGGQEAVSTRAVGAAARVKAPTIYRLFGDKQGLLDAVATDGFTAYFRSKTALGPTADPIEDLRTGWDLHVGFGLANPALYLLMYAQLRPEKSPVLPTAAGIAMLTAHIHRIAEAGRLRVDEERAAQLVHAAGSGTTISLITLPEDRRDLELSTLARESVIAAITTEAPVSDAPGPVPAAVALRAVLQRTDVLTDGELSLLREWLDRIARSTT